MREDLRAPPVALTIAGSDSGGGAGIQADLKAFFALGVFGASAVTAVTAQNTRGVQAVFELEASLVRQQIRAVRQDFDVRAIKTGMLGGAAIVRAVSDELASQPPGALVVDPVLVAKSGDSLLDAEGILALRRDLLPLARVITPNLPEAARLLERSEREVLQDPEGACRALLELGPSAVLLKGGHAHGTWSEDLLFDGQTFLRLSGRRIDTKNTHGTGCTLSAALCAGLAQGRELAEAARAARAYVQGAIEGSREWRLGAGHGPLDHWAKRDASNT